MVPLPDGTLLVSLVVTAQTELLSYCFVRLSRAGEVLAMFNEIEPWSRLGVVGDALVCVGERPA